MAKRKPKVVETSEEAAKPIESPNIVELDVSARLNKLEQRFENLKACILRAQPPKDV